MTLNNKQQITTDEEIKKAYARSFADVVGYVPEWAPGEFATFTQILRVLLSDYELIPYRPEDKLGVVVEVTEENGTVSRFVNVASGKWYCDGRPNGRRFLNTSAIQRLSPRPHF